MPSDKSVTSVIDVESSNNELLPQFAESTVSVNDAGGTARSYKLYKYRLKWSNLYKSHIENYNSIYIPKEFVEFQMA